MPKQKGTIDVGQCNDPMNSQPMGFNDDLTSLQT